MFIFCYFFTLGLGCFRDPPPPRPCTWNVGNWRLRTVEGDLIGECPWKVCIGVKEEKERSACMMKHPGDCAWVREDSKCEDLRSETYDTVKCERRRQVTRMFRSYVRTQYLNWSYADRKFRKIRQIVSIPSIGRCAVASFTAFMVEDEVLKYCGGDLRKIPGNGYDTCFRYDAEKNYYLWE